MTEILTNNDGRAKLVGWPGCGRPTESNRIELPFWVHDLLPINILVLLVMAGTNLVVVFRGLHRGPFYPLFSALVILPLIGSK